MGKRQWFLGLDWMCRLPLPGLAEPLPLGMTSGGARLSRPKQIDFFQRFMSMPFVPSYSPLRFFSLHRRLTFPFPDYCILDNLSQHYLPNLGAAIVACLPSVSSHVDLAILPIPLQLILTDMFLEVIQPHGMLSEFILPLLHGISFYGFPSAFLVIASCFGWLLGSNLGQGTNLGAGLLWDSAECPLCRQDEETLAQLRPTCSLTAPSLELYGSNGSSFHNSIRKVAWAALLLHHNLTVEAAWPELFVDHVGPPKQHESQLTSGVPMTLLLGLSIRNAFSFKKNVDIWGSKAPKLKMVQSFDILLSNPHISASGLLGAVLTACLGDNLVRSPVEDNSLPFEGLGLRASGINSTILADIFASMSVSMQHGNFQRCYSAGSTQDLYNSHQPRVEAIQAICPIATLSLQQQIAGTFSFRVDSGVSLDLKNSGWHLSVDDPVFAIEYAFSSSWVSKGCCLVLTEAARIYDRASFS
ncbi:pigment defective 320 [Actinidia rufa]|uniref:Pigment defective 320 n=1 Tax=Actinidia rufa TaxID=165716 RepID=A0A7J0GEI2_9ERIC|nr:pigment defective 320 [Actinidia rufa]